MITIFNIRPKGHNIGNEAINVGLKSMLYKHIGRLVNIISIPATHKYDSGTLFGLSSSTVHLINRIGDGVIVGGGNLLENNELVFDSQSLHSLKPPLALFSVSRGRIYDRHYNLSERTDVIPDEKLKILVQRSDVCLVRDYATFDYLTKLGIKKHELGGCPTVCIDEMTQNLNSLPIGEDVGVLLSVRKPELMNIPVRLQSEVPLITKRIVELIRQNGYKRIRLLVHDPRDLEYAMSFQGVDAVFTSDVWEYLALIKECELLVSFRLHASLPALSMGKPVINLSYDERSLSLVNTIGLSEWDIDIIKSPDLMLDIQDRIKSIDSLSSKINEIKKNSWNNTVTTMEEGMMKFSNMIKSYARQPVNKHKCP